MPVAGLSDHDLIELKTWLQPWFKTRNESAGSSAPPPVFQRLSTQFAVQFATDSQVAPLVQDWEFGGFVFTAGSDPATPATWSVPLEGYYSVEITCDALMNQSSDPDELVMEFSGWEGGFGPNPSDPSGPFDSYLQFDDTMTDFGTQFRAPLAISGQIYAGTDDVLKVIFSSNHEWLVSHLIVSMKLIGVPVDVAILNVDGGSA